MKKIIIAVIVLLSLKVSATNAVDHFSGLYVGGAFGRNSLTSSQALVFDPSKVANTVRYNLNQSNRDTLFESQWYFGYGHLFTSIPIYLAAEGVGNFYNQSITISSSNINSKIEQNNAFGGRVKLGYGYKTGLLYVLAGLERTSIHRNIAFINGGIYNSGSMFLQDIINNNYSVTIKQLGTGFNLALCSGWVAQVEYAHNVYNKTTASAINHTIIQYNNPKGTYASIFNQGNEITLGLRYIFH